MNKRGVEPQVLVVLIIVMAGALILFSFAYSTAGQLKENADVDTCRLSVLAQAQTKFFGKSVVKLDCPRRNIKIFENKVELNGKTSKKYSFGKLTQEEVNKIAAEELRLCWYKMAEGNRNVLEQSIFFSDSKYYQCLICSEIEFDEKLRGRMFEGLDDYLKSSKIPNEAISYFEYLIRSQRNLYLLWGGIGWTQYTPYGHGKTGKIDDQKFDTNSRYLIYFLAMKPTWLVEQTEAYTSAYYIGLGKQDKIREECDILMN
ncbi:hypothetical protein HYX08_03970 [Candidatus Woesearchaeota archaeon]|nr:hypothetical protein [Candidatus Woesearchaeota archaeon]